MSDTLYNEVSLDARSKHLSGIRKAQAERAREAESKIKSGELTGKDLGLTTVKGRLLLPKEVAPFLRMSERNVQRLIHIGMFPIRVYFISPKLRLVDSYDLNDYLQKVRAEAGTYILPETAVKKIVKEEVSA